MINAAVIGLGWWGKHLVNTLGDSDKIRIVRAVDADPEPFRAFAKERGIPVTGEYDDALADPAIDAVLITTPNQFHEEQIVRAARAGKHVMGEKPLALTRASAERAVRACETAGVVLGVGHERRFEPALREIKRLANDGAFGKILHVESAFNHDKLRDVDQANWRVSKTASPIPAFTATGIHLTDLYIDLVGDVAEVDARNAVGAGTGYSGSALSVQLAFSAGATGHISAILTTPLFLRFHVFGTDAWAEARNESHPDTPGVTHLTVCRRDQDPVTTDYAWVDATRENYEAFADTVAGGGAYPITTHQKIHNIAVMEAVFASAERGRPVRVA